MSKVFGSLFGKKPKQVTQPTGFETLPLEAQQGFTDLLSRAQGLPTDIFAPAPFTPGETQGIEGLQRIGANQLPAFGFGQQANQAFGQAADIFGRVPGQVDLANQAVGRATGLVGQGVNPITGEEIQTGISQFLNPFTGEVIEGAARDIREQGRGVASDIAGAATGAGAFGGTRQALLESELQRNILRNIGDVSGRLRSQGFESAAGRALSRLTGERERFLTGAGLELQGGQVGLGGAQALTGLGSQLGGLGSQLFGAREGARRLRLGSAEASLQAGQLQRGLQGQQQQAPLQQLQFLQSILGSVPGGGGGISFQDQPGLLQRIGGAQQGLSTLGGGLSAAGGLFN